MIPLSVRMTGWMRYRDETVADFSHGTLIAICGENGAGKSSIFDAITFALYGRVAGERPENGLVSVSRPDGDFPPQPNTIMSASSSDGSQVSPSDRGMGPFAQRSGPHNSSGARTGPAACP